MSKKSVFKKSAKSTYLADIRAIATAHIAYRKVAGTKEQTTLRPEGFHGHLSGKHNMFEANEQAWTRTIDYLDRHNRLDATKLRGTIITSREKGALMDLSDRVAILEGALNIKRS